MENFLLLLIFIYLVYCQDRMLFYKTERKFCEKYKGNCAECDCWSCKRKEVLEENELEADYWE